LESTMLLRWAKSKQMTALLINHLRE